MEENNILSGGAAELKEVREALENRKTATAELEQCRSEEQRMEKQIAGEERRIQNEITSTVNKRRNEITKSFDKEISKEKDILRGVKNKRDKAKSKGMKARISDETAHLIEENKGLHSEIRTAFSNRGIPSYCDSAWYYTLFMPKKVKELVIFILTAILALLVVPDIILLLIGGRWWLNIILYLVIVMAEAAVYVTIYLFTKDKDKDILVNMREKRNQISRNEKEIRKIRKEIRNDKDDSIYNLGEFDSKIKAAEENISEIVVKKNEALAEFENHTKTVITEEIQNREKERMEGLREELAKVKEDHHDSEQRQKDLNLMIASKYEAFLGVDMMSLEKIDEMLRLLEEGQVVNVSEALNKVRATTA